jgi:glycosyltransferase involved in cell wall biosynthesis
MKILVLQDFLRSGGTERQSILLANAFTSAGHAVTLLTFRPGGPLASTVAPGVTRRTLQPFDLTLDWFAPGLIAEVRRIEPDVVLCMGRMANCYAGGIQVKLPAAVVISTMRTGKPLPARFIQSMQSVRHVVANSQDARATLVNQHAIPGEKISVIHNSLVFPASPAGDHPTLSREVVRARHGASGQVTVMLCVAMFRPEKNQRELIETIAALPPSLDWQLWLAGEGPARAPCERLVAEKQLAARVKFLGFQRDPSALYAAADLAVHASASEALSNFVIEAQAHGVPAVVYQAQGMEECFLPGETGWAIPRADPDAFRATILRLANGPAATRATRSATARAFARLTFDPAAQAAAYLDLFARLRTESRIE